MMKDRLENLVKLADKQQRIITFRADVKTPAGMKERLYRVTLPNGKVTRDGAIFEVYVAKQRRSYPTWHMMSTNGASVNQLWEMVLEMERERANV